MKSFFYIYNAENKLVELLAENLIGRNAAELEKLAYEIANKHNGTVKIVRKK